MINSMIERQALRSLATMLLLVISLSACATVSKDWQLQKTNGELKYYTRAGSEASLPEFKATIDVDAPVNKVVNVIMDFNRHAEWVHGCEQSSVIAVNDFSTAYIYQVTKLPIVRGRDMIMLANVTQNDDTKQVEISLKSAHDYCDDKTDRSCANTHNEEYVRVEQAAGTFLLSAKDENKTHIEWTQFIDPAGALPDWLIRLNLAQVPMKSLHQLKEMIENE